MRIDRRSFVLETSRVLLAPAAVMASSAALAQHGELPRRPASHLPSGARSQFAQTNGIRTHFVMLGSGPLLILLHGWPQTWFAWREVMPRLGKRFTVVAPDLRGIGLSERTKTGYDKRTIAEDLRALIGHAGAKQAHIVGHDMGGKASYVFAHLYPETVSKLVLVDCLVPGTENMDALRGGAWHYGFHMAAEVPEMLTRGRERDYIRAQTREWSRIKDAISESAIAEYAYHYASPGGMTAGFNYYSALREDAQFVATLRSRKLPMPVMTIAGRYGVGDKLADALRLEADDLTSVVAENSGHFVAEEAPEFFCERLESFLSS